MSNPFLVDLGHHILVDSAGIHRPVPVPGSHIQTVPVVKVTLLVLVDPLAQHGSG